jgi:glycosyltransferase involved in cell wall biosynthesis
VTDRTRRIAVDGRELVGQPTGVGRYLQAVLREWARLPESEGRFTVVLPSEPTPELLAAVAGPNLNWVVEPGVAGTWWEQTRLPRAVARAGADALFAPAYTAPLRAPCPTVVTIHDLSYFAHPEWFSWREGLRRRWLTRAAARRAAMVLTVSEFSAGEIVSRLGVPRARVRVIPHGAPACAAGRAASARPPLVLYVGSLFTRRHLPDLVQGFALAAGRVPAARLVLVGDNRTRPRVDPRDLAARAGVADRVDWRAYAPEDELERLYGEARVFVFLSDYEGFAMTPLEAMAHGIPPVLLDTAVAREVFGEAAWYVPPAPAAIASAVERLLVDDAAHQALAAAGRERLVRFSWTRSAAAALDVLREAARR